MDDRIVAETIKKLEEDNRQRERDIAMHGQLKDQLIDMHVRAQGAIEELKNLLKLKEDGK